MEVLTGVVNHPQYMDSPIDWGFLISMALLVLFFTYLALSSKRDE